MLEVKGQSKDLSDARPALINLLPSLKEKIYSDTGDSCKFAIPNLYRVVQWKLDQKSIVALCSFSTKNNGSLTIKYFADHPLFGIDVQIIDHIVQNDLFYITYSIESTSKKLGIKFNELVKTVEEKSDYEKEVCCLYKYENGLTNRTRLYSIHLCGTESIARKVYEDIKTISNEYAPILCNVELNTDQVNYLLKVRTKDLIDFENRYDVDGVDLQSKLQNPEKSQFIAPKYLHEKSKLFLLEMSQVQIVSKEIQSSVQLVQAKQNELYELALKNGCLFSITLTSQTTATNISSGLINICLGDLAAHQSDVLVICSTSNNLRANIVKAAGQQVLDKLQGVDFKKAMINTPVGHLQQAKQLLFLPWIPEQDADKLHQSISLFVEQAVTFAIKDKYKSIAFPAIGCGDFGIPPDFIAKAMIDAAHEQLAKYPNAQLGISLVIQQPTIYNVFKAALNSTSMITSSSISSLPPNREKLKIFLTTARSTLGTAKNLLDTIETALTA